MFNGLDWHPTGMTDLDALETWLARQRAPVHADSTTRIIRVPRPESRAH
jgi:hypothetical protein